MKKGTITVSTYVNPFTPVFGNDPPILAGRKRLIDDVLMGLANQPGDPNRITIFTGPRGSGKTVLLNTIAARAEGIGWISVHTTASSQMLDQLIEQIERRAAHLIQKRPKSKITGIQFSGAGMQRQLLDEKKPTWRARIDEYLDMLAEHGVGLLFAVDECSADFPEMVEFKITDEGVLKNSKLIVSEDRRISGINSKGVVFARDAFDTSGGMITIGYLQDPSDPGSIELIACESDTRLYTIDGRDWKVEKPTKAIMTKYAIDGYRFIFLKSDKDKGFDIIIRVEEKS